MMRKLKKIFKITGITIGVIIILIFTAVVFVAWGLPIVSSAPAMKIDITPQRVARGKYLANNVMACMACHSSRNWNVAGAPMIEGTEGKGGDKFTQDSLGFFGDMYFPNITPYGIGDWTDGEIFRAITTGVDKDGNALTPIMPYEFYGKVDSEDIKCVIAYLRTLKPMESKSPPKQVPFFIKMVNNLAPGKPAFQQKPSENDTIAYGKYLATSAACVSCHSPFKGLGGVDYDHPFAGGPEFTMPSGRVRPINLTPDKETGIGTWSKEDFINLFKRFRDTSVLHQHIDPKADFSTLMPWPFFAGMSDKDLGAIYSYLRTIKPIRNKVERFTPASAVIRDKE